MTISDRKQREKQALKSRILAQAEKIMADEGVDNLSMRKIASAIDYSPTTIYRFFKDKNSLLSTIINRNHTEITRRFQRVLEDSTLDSLHRLKYLIREYIRFGLEFKDTYKLYTHLCKFEIIDQGLYETIGGKRYRVFSSWQSQIEALIGEGLIQAGNSLQIVLYVWHVTHGFISNRILVKEIDWGADEDEIDKLIENIFSGIIVCK
jgi:AcrR family transcriptional regulator